MVKYADGPTVEVDVLIDAPIERVWQLVTDINAARPVLDRVPRRRLARRRPVGRRSLRGRNHHDAMGEWETTSFVNRYEPLLRVRLGGHRPRQPVVELVVRAGTGTARRPPPPGHAHGPGTVGAHDRHHAMPDKEERIIARRLAEYETNMRATLEGIKQLAEAQR